MIWTVRTVNNSNYTPINQYLVIQIKDPSQVQSYNWDPEHQNL